MSGVTIRVFARVYLCKTKPITSLYTSILFGLKLLVDSNLAMRLVIVNLTPPIDIEVDIRSKFKVTASFKTI